MVLSVDARAQVGMKPSPSLMGQYETATRNTIREVLRKLEPLLARDQAAKYRSVSIDVQKDSWDIYGFAANSSTGKPSVAVPMGLVYLLDYVDSAALQGELLGVSRAQITGYINLFMDEVLENIARKEGGKPQTALTSFPVYAGLTPAQIRRVETDPLYSAQKDVLKLSTFAFLMYHEVAHLIVPEAAPSLLPNVREKAADQFALRTGLAADFNPMFVFYSFLFFAKLEEAQNIDAEKLGYEPAICRASKFFISGVDAGLKDKEFVRYMDRNGLLVKFYSAPGEIQTILEEDGVNCDLNIPASLVSSIEKAKAKGVFAEVEAKVKIWRPQPGSCSGASGDLLVDGEEITSFDNTEDLSDLELGSLSVGKHEFAFEDVTAYCIAPYPPYPMNIGASDMSCRGSFTVPKSGKLKLAMNVLPGDRLHCAIK
jgi:hypothetical protein